MYEEFSSTSSPPAAPDPRYSVVDIGLALAILMVRLPDSPTPRLTGRPLAVTTVTVSRLTKWTFLLRQDRTGRLGSTPPVRPHPCYPDFAEHDGLELVADDPSRGMACGANHSTSEVTRDIGREPKAHVKR